jgi:hypothetical protein
MSEEDPPILGEPPAGASPISSDNPEHALSRIRALLDRIAGQAGGDALLDRLLQTDEPIASVVRDLANSPGFARLFKEVRTLSIGANGLKEPDPEYVGVENLDRSLPFEVQFDRFFGHCWTLVRKGSPRSSRPSSRGTRGR